MIPFLDLAAATAELRPELDQAIERVLSSGRYIGGPECEEFEEEFASYCEADHAVGVGNGLDALELALRALGIGDGDEVIVAANTFIATLLAVTAAGATPVLVEPDPATHNIDAAKVEVSITSRTKCLLPTHLYGQSADLGPLLALAAKHRLFLIEDAAQAHGARYEGRRIGAHGHAVCWSFYPGKNLGALGDGGAVTTNDAALAEEIRRLGNYGSQQKYVHEVRGTNSRLDPLQAAVLRVKLKHLDRWNERRAELADLYRDRLAGTGLVLPEVPDWADPSWHLFVVRSDERDELQRRLADAGVQTLIHYPVPPHRQQAYADLRIPAEGLPITERLAGQVLSLPTGPHLGIGCAEAVAAAVRALA